MRRTLLCPLIVFLLLTGFVPMVSAGGARDEEGTYKELLQNLDSSIMSLRHGGSADLSRAKVDYDNLVLERYENRDFGNDKELIDLDNKISNTFATFIAQGGNIQEENIRALRSNISLMASKLGIGISPIYGHALFIVLGIGALAALLITLLNKRMVNWERMRQIKAEVSAFQKKFREARSKRDMKSIHKLQQDQKRILSLQGEMMKENFKPTLIYIAAWFLMWYFLRGVYSGWVVAWLPFSLSLPFYGAWASCGFLSWYLITYFGFSQVFRKLLIRD